MNKPERIEIIMRTLKSSKASTVQELAQLLQVSHMTIRRDIAALVKEERIRMLYGGIILNPDGGDGGGNESYYSLISAGSKFPDRKRRIGQLAATLIEPEDTLIIDAGSTAEYFAKCLPEDRNYTVLCYALNIVSETVRRKNIRTMFSGGIFHENTLMFESSEGLSMISRYRATKAFITASGVNHQFGVTCMNHYERETKKAAILSSMKKILLVDSSKFGTVRSDYFAELADFDEIITDEGIPEEYAEIIKKLGVKLRIA
ncbi:MAG: DeoR/GlpR family DNA-binding transcription regulator [Spirochaetales bacterium]|jgi:DeoR family deoxyribose operon repressor